MKKYYLGVDGGATKTHCLLFNIETKKVNSFEFGASNHENMPNGFKDLKIVLKNMIDMIVQSAGIEIDDLNTCVFGIAGVDTKQQHSTISDIISDIGIKKFVLCNDAFLGVKTCSSGYGICAINGTGFCITGIDPHGNELQVGGIGYFTGDKGGGSYIATTAISSVYEELFKGGKKTLLTDMMYKEFVITDKSEFLNTIMDVVENDQKNAFLTICKSVYKAANENDQVATELLLEVGKEYEKSILATIDSLNFEDAEKIEVVLAGSQFVKGDNSTTRDYLEKHLKTVNNKIDVCILRYPCSFGALLWAVGELETQKSLAAHCKF